MTTTRRTRVHLDLTAREAAALAGALGEVFAGEWDAQLDHRERAALLRAADKLSAARRRVPPD